MGIYSNPKRLECFVRDKMKNKIMLATMTFLMVMSSIANAARYETECDGKKVVMIMGKTIQHTDQIRGDRVAMFYEEKEHALYIFTIGLPNNGHLIFQKRKEALDVAINRYIEENKYKLGNLPIRKIYLGACRQALRHPNNPKELYIGRNPTYNADIYEILQNEGTLITLHATFKGEQGIIICPETFLKDEDCIKAAKRLAKKNKLKWALNLLKKEEKGDW